MYLRDVAYVHAGGPPQQNIVMVKGQQAVLLQILKTGDASTLAVVEGVRAKLPGILKMLPPGVTIMPLDDASTFVRASIDDVVQEMLTAAVLAGIAVLVFVGSWRSTLIVAASIPLSILSSVIALSVVGQDINVMTLGGLALAVGILVDDATVMIENINTHLEMAEKSGGEVDLKQAIIEASNQIVVPTFVSTTCICIVWVPLFQLGGVAGYLFLPLAEAVIFAMIASFILSRTLTPTLADYLLRGQVAALQGKGHEARPGIFGRFHRGFEVRFERFRDDYRGLLERLAPQRRVFCSLYLMLAFASLMLLVFVGQDFFPSIKSGTIAMHMRFASGTRIEETAKLAVLVDQQVHELLPGHVVGSLLNCGLPSTGINQAYSNSGTIGSQDCDLTVSLDNQASPVARYQQTLRAGLAERFPGAQFSFLAGDITAQILNFGLPSPIDIRISGRDLDENYAFATKLAARIRKVAGAADVRIQQIMDQPTLQLDSNRSLALGIGLNESLIADNVLATLSGSGQTAPTYWLDPSTGVSHLVNVQTPQNQMQSVNALQTIPVRYHRVYDRATPRGKRRSAPTSNTPRVTSSNGDQAAPASCASSIHYVVQPVLRAQVSATAVSDLTPTTILLHHCRVHRRHFVGTAPLRAVATPSSITVSAVTQLHASHQHLQTSVMRLLIENRQLPHESRDVLRLLATPPDHGRRYRRAPRRRTLLHADRNDHFTCSARDEQEQLNFLDLLRAGHTDYVVNQRRSTICAACPAGLSSTSCAHQLTQFADQLPADASRPP